MTAQTSSVAADEAPNFSEFPGDARLATAFSGETAVMAEHSATMFRQSPADHMLEPRAGKVLGEIGKQTIDQAGHFLIGAAPIWASRYLVGVPWYGWAIAPLLAYREWLQWPSKRWWDPPLDWAFLGLGAVVATCRRRLKNSGFDWLSGLGRRITRASFASALWSDTTSGLVHARAAPEPDTARRRRSFSAAARAEFPR